MPHGHLHRHILALLPPPAIVHRWGRFEVSYDDSRPHHGELLVGLSEVFEQCPCGVSKGMTFSCHVGPTSSYAARWPSTPRWWYTCTWTSPLADMGTPLTHVVRYWCPVLPDSYPIQGRGKGRTAKHCLRDTDNHGSQKAMKVVRQAWLEVRGGSTPD